MSVPNTLSTATLDRKARLAQLKSLKRKEPSSDIALPEHEISASNASPADATTDEPKSYLSGRNYDSATRGPKLGFESTPTGEVDTVEAQAARLALSEKEQRDKEAKEDKPLDLFKLQPKKPNWDLKRELDKRLEVLNVRTDNAIARLVRERIEKQSSEGKEREGAELVAGMKELEREQAEDQDLED